jgi:hypothetical protein
LDDDKQQQIRALGRLGWTLSRIQEPTGIRRETISGYLKAAGIAVRSRERPSESNPQKAPRATCSPLQPSAPTSAPVCSWRRRIQRARRLGRNAETPRLCALSPRLREHLERARGQGPFRMAS